VILKVEDNQDPLFVPSEIASLGNSVVALTNQQWEVRTTNWILRETGILINFTITIVLCLAIGPLVAGQTFYTFVLNNLRHFGALKAMGLRNISIMGMIATQVVIVAMIGYGIGVGLASISGVTLGGVGLAFAMSWPIVAAEAVGIVVCGMFAGLLKLVHVTRLESAIVFRS